MNLHEYQAKELLKKFKLPVPKGIVFIENLSQIEENLETLKGPPWVVKSQIHAGGRGAGKFKNNFNDMGGVQVVSEKNKVFKIAESMINNVLITKQTGDKGKEVKRIYIEEGCKIKKEFYLSILIDRNTSQPMMMISASGSMDIEEVAAKSPEKIIKFTVDPASGLSGFHGRRVAFALGLKGKQIKQCVYLVQTLFKLFSEKDCEMLEINPLILTKDEKLICLDCKMGFDSNAMYRQPSVVAFHDETEEDPKELAASKFDLNYIALDGEIGCMVNGAGLAMATMDIIKLFGSEPANFLDVGGGATKEKVTEAFKIITSDKNVKGILVNIFGGIMRCDVIAEGVVEAVKNVGLSVPLVVRLEGTNVDKGKDIINQSGLNVIAADNLSDAAKKIVTAVKGS